MTGHDGARGLIVGTDLPLFVSCFCIFAHTFASQMRPGGKQQHSYGDGTFPKSSAQLLEDSHHHRQGETIKKAEQFKTEDMSARDNARAEKVSPASREASKPNCF